MRLTFAADPATFSVSAETRTIRGLAVPYGGAVAVSEGKRWAFSKGSLDFSRAKHLMDHEGRPVGRVAEVNDTDEGAYVALKVARGAAGDELLQLAEDGVYDGLSIGLGNPAEIKFTTDAEGVHHVTSAPVREVSSTPFPAFDASRITSVALSTTQKGTTMADATDVNADGVEQDVVSGTISGTVTITPDAPAASEDPAANLSATAAGATFSMSQLAQAVAQVLTPGAPEARPVISAAAGAQFQVTEADLYRFDGRRGQHEFSSDLFAALKGDYAAHQRVNKFIGAKFAAPVTTGDINGTGIGASTVGINPPRYRPDLYVGSDPIMTPVFDMLFKGSLTDNTPFIVPKFSSASTTRTLANVGTTNASTALTGNFLVGDVGAAISGTGIPAGATIVSVVAGTSAVLSANATATGTITATLTYGLVTDHTEGNEPTGGDWTATSQTVTPSAVSGEIDITREVIDAGGNPQVSALIWAEIVKAYGKAMEAKAAGLLTNSAAAELGAVLGAIVDGALVQGVTAKLGTLPFLAYGLNFGTVIPTHVDLYNALISAKDSAGRPLLPISAPINANGSSADRMQSVNVGGYRFVPAPSLGVTAVNKKSYAFDPSFGGVWASDPQQITLLPTVAYGAKIGVFGYVGAAVLNATRVTKLTY